MSDRLMEIAQKAYFIRMNVDLRYFCQVDGGHSWEREE